MATTFLNTSPSEDVAAWVRRMGRVWDPARAWGVRDRGRWVASLRTEPRTVTVPGWDGATELLAADALTNVTVAATHRRRGLLRTMLEDSLRAARARGDAVSILIAAEWPIYGRYGYAAATTDSRYVLHPRRPGATVTASEPGAPGRVRQVDADEYARIAPAVFKRARARRAGQVDRDAPWYDQAFGRDGWGRPHPPAPDNCLVRDGDDGPDGLLAWTPTREAPSQPPLGAISVRELFAAGHDAERDLWAYLTGLDLVDEITLEDRPPDEAVRLWLPDARTLVLAEQTDCLWLKLLDVAAALTARGYAVPGELVLEVVDDSAVSVAGRYRLAADPATAHAACEPTADAPDLTVSQPALAAAYLGGFPLRARLATGEVTEHVPGALTRADAMLAGALAPWNATEF
jgi:predicted acetyltransferase